MNFTRFCAAGGSLSPPQKFARRSQLSRTALRALVRCEPHCTPSLRTAASNEMCDKCSAPPLNIPNTAGHCKATELSNARAYTRPRRKHPSEAAPPRTNNGKQARQASPKDLCSHPTDTSRRAPHQELVGKPSLSIGAGRHSSN